MPDVLNVGSVPGGMLHEQATTWPTWHCSLVEWSSSQCCRTTPRCVTSLGGCNEHAVWRRWSKHMALRSAFHWASDK
eukprot:4559263-Pyramimonas_sp.AAC.1